MTERKPAWMRPEDWIERQIREAEERGEFDNLAGAGKPIPGLDRPFSAERWAADLIRREGGDIASLLPPLLALRKERVALLASLGELPDEDAVRVVVQDFNHRLLEEYRKPMDGPLLAVGVLDLDRTLDAWRAARPAPAPAAVVEAPAEPRPVRRRWWRS